MKNLLLPIFTFLSLSVNAQTWDFTSKLSSTDVTNLEASKDLLWTYDGDNDRWKNKGAIDGELTANSSTLEWTAGLLFVASGDDYVRLDNGKRLAFNNSSLTITIPNCASGYKFTMKYKSSAGSSSSDDVRYVYVTNLGSETTTFEAPKDVEEVAEGYVASAGNVVITVSGGMYIYSIEVRDASGDAEQSTDGSTTKSSVVDQMILATTDGGINYYNVSDLNNVTISDDNSEVKVTLLNGSTDYYKNSAKKISFKKSFSEVIKEGEISENGISIVESRGWCESLYAKFTCDKGYDDKIYKAYIASGDDPTWNEIDGELIRCYTENGSSYGRVDVVGLAAGTYTLKITAIDENGDDDSSTYATISDLDVINYQREGFAFTEGYETTGIGAYNIDGTLKENTIVLYVTKDNAATITVDGLVADSSNPTGTFSGIQSIITAYQSYYQEVPLCIRLIGQISYNDVDKFESNEGLYIKGKKEYHELNITIEGIGDDATIHGFGLHLRNATSVELRNFAVMDCLDDCVSIDTDNSHLWVHNLDLFYGQAGSDSDQAKGDGSLDIKGNSKYTTFAFNHLFDSGKTSLCGMTSESGPNYIDYHHNWFDHSDSRHPRVRTMSVHVWNNYYDGVAKYGVGSTLGSSIFVENNYFRHSKYPMLISLQGHDAEGDGTFSNETGGIIKSYGNVYAETNNNSAYIPYTQNDKSDNFDCYQVTSRDETIPSTVVSPSSSKTYDNFDTDSSIMFSYKVDDAEDVPDIVTGYYGAGRLNHGDFVWEFTSDDDSSSSVDSNLKTKVVNYTSTFTSIIGQGSADYSSSSGDDSGESGGGSSSSSEQEITPTEGSGFYYVDYTNKTYTVMDGITNTAYSGSGLLTVNSDTGFGNSDKSSITYGNTTYSAYFKCNSNMSLTFSASNKVNVKLIFSDSNNGNSVYLEENNTKTSVTIASSVVEFTVNNSSVTVTKNSTESQLYIIEYSEVTSD